MSVFQSSVLGVLAVALFVLFPVEASAIDFTFQKILDESTELPGLPSTMSGVSSGPTSLDGGTAAFT